VTAMLLTPAATEDLVAENERLLQLDQMKDELISMVSHELRTPLTSIVGYLEMLTGPEAEPLTEQQTRFLGIISRSAERLLSLISDLLMMAQVDSDGVKLEQDQVDLGALVEECVASVRPLAASRKVSLFAAIHAAQVCGDRRLLAEVVDNLLSNALKFTPEHGSVFVRIGDLGESVCVEVRDTGIGIPAEEREQLFTRFYRSRAAVERAVQGTGLGLSIVKAIVDAHNGAIEVDSDVGRGSTFRVVLPAGRRK